MALTKDQKKYVELLRKSGGRSPFASQGLANSRPSVAQLIAINKSIKGTGKRFKRLKQGRMNRGLTLERRL